MLMTLAQSLVPAEQSDLLSSIPELEPGVSAEALESATISPWWIACGTVVLLLLIAGITVYIIRKRRTPKPQPTAEEIALNRVANLRGMTPDLRTASLELSMILREYLSNKTQDTALYETHEEFSRRLDSLSAIPRECQYTTRMLLEKFAEMKYAAIHGDAQQQVNHLIEETQNTILSIQEARQKEADAARELEKVRKLS